MQNWTKQFYAISSGSSNLKYGYAEEFNLPPIPYLSETHTTTHPVKMTKEVLHSIEKIIALHYEDEESNYLDWIDDCDDESNDLLSKINGSVYFDDERDKHISELAEIGINTGYNHMFLDLYGMKKWYDENLIARENILNI